MDWSIGTESLAGFNKEITENERTLEQTLEIPKVKKEWDGKEITCSGNLRLITEGPSD